MTEKGTTEQIACVSFRRSFSVPVEKVWAHLTETARLPSWFGEDSRIEPRAGGALRLMGGHIRGIVTQWQPPRKLIYTWNVFDPEDGPDAVSAYPESYPTFELEPRGGETLLSFRHFPIPPRFVPQTAMGWHTMLDILGAALGSGAVEDREACMARNAALYGVDLDDLAR